MHEYEMQLEKEFRAAIKRIEKYGGFYIGRYETGGLNGKAKIVKGDINLTNQAWYTMYEKCKTLGGSNENVSTGMIWGCEQDRVLMWLIESGNKSKEEIAQSSKYWGNYIGTELKYVDTNGNIVQKSAYTYIIIPSGASEQTKANNIYDLAGNVEDWSMETYSTNGRGARGGCYNNYSSAVSSSSRKYDYPIYSNMYNVAGCRATLYIK